MSSTLHLVRLRRSEDVFSICMYMYIDWSEGFARAGYLIPAREEGVWLGDLCFFRRRRRRPTAWTPKMFLW